MKSFLILCLSSLFILFSSCKKKGEVTHFNVEKSKVVPRAVSTGMSNIPATPGTAQPSTTSSSPQKSPYTWTLPEGWSAKPASGMRLATILIPSANNPSSPLNASITECGGDLAGNINRWRGQLGLPPVDSAAAIQSLTPFDSPLGKKGKGYITLLTTPTDRAILAAIIPRPTGTSVFVKVTGNSSELKEIEPSFATFLKSLQSTSQ